MYICTHGGEFFVFDLNEQQIIANIKIDGEGFHSFSLTLDDNYIIASCFDGGFIVFDIRNKRSISKSRIEDIGISQDGTPHSGIICGIDFINGTTQCILSYSENGILIYDYLKYIVIHSFNGIGYYCFVIENGKKALIGSDSFFICYDT